MIRQSQSTVFLWFPILIAYALFLLVADRMAARRETRRRTVVIEAASVVAAHFLGIGILMYVDLFVLDGLDPKFDRVPYYAFLDFYWPLWIIFSALPLFLSFTAAVSMRVRTRKRRAFAVFITMVTLVAMQLLATEVIPGGLHELVAVQVALSVGFLIIAHGMRGGRGARAA